MPETGFSSSTNGVFHRPRRSQTWATSRLPCPATGGWGLLGDDAAVGCQLVEPHLSGVALGNRVRRQEAELPSLPQQETARKAK